MDARSKSNTLLQFCHILSFIFKMVYTFAMIYSKFKIWSIYNAGTGLKKSHLVHINWVKQSENIFKKYRCKQDSVTYITNISSHLLIFINNKLLWNILKFKCTCVILWSSSLWISVKCNSFQISVAKTSQLNIQAVVFFVWIMKLINTKQMYTVNGVNYMTYFEFLQLVLHDSCICHYCMLWKQHSFHIMNPLHQRFHCF